MRDESMTERRSSSLSAIAWPVWLLLAGAIVQLGIAIAPDSYRVFGPYLLVDAGMVLGWIQAISLFLLAAAVVLAAARWPTGRRRFLLGAAALTIVALLRMADDIWWVLWDASGVAYEGIQPWLFAKHLGAGVMFVAAHLLFAAGLWTSPAPRPASRARSVILAGIGFGGLVATGFWLWLAAQSLALVPPDYPAFLAATSTLTAAAFAALAVLAFAAARVAPARGGLPEMLIAIGAGVTLAATAWNSIVPHLTARPAVMSEERIFWVFTLPFIAEVAGLIMMIAGFGLAAIAVHGARTADVPRA